MPALIFETLHELPISSERANIGNEPNNQLIKYGIDNLRQVNDGGQLINADYNSFDWQTFPAAITSQAIQDIGTKNFPQVGACAFAVLKYSDSSIIVAPVFPSTAERFPPPSFIIVQEGGFLIITITPPEEAIYECYRVVFRNGPLAEEFITYETVLTIPILPIDTYDVTVIGYIDELVASKEAEGTFIIT